jgi:hypothetical protein
MDTATGILIYVAAFLCFCLAAWFFLRSAHKKSLPQKNLRRVLGWAAWLAAVFSCAAATVWWSIACACVKD